MMVPDR